MSDRDRRLDELRRRILRDPASVLFVGLSEEYRRLGRFREAVDVAEAGLRHHPGYVAGRVSLARALIALGARGRARIELERVVDSVPDNIAALKLLVELCRDLNLPEQALAHLHRLAVLSPHDTEVRQSLDRVRDRPDEQAARRDGDPLGLDDVDALDRFVRSRPEGSGG